MTKEELKQWFKDSVEARPFDEDDYRDGNWNYIHRTKVSQLLFELKVTEKQNG